MSKIGTIMAQLGATITRATQSVRSGLSRLLSNVKTPLTKGVQAAKLSGGIIYWVVYQGLSVLTDLAGLIVLAPLSALGLTTERESLNPMFPGKVTCWRGGKWTLIWGNDEDGVFGSGRKAGSRLDAYKWTALRNRSNNLRLLPLASRYVSNQVKFKDYSWGYIATDSYTFCIGLPSRRIGWLITRDAKEGYRSWPVC